MKPKETNGSPVYPLRSGKMRHKNEASELVVFANIGNHKVRLEKLAMLLDKQGITFTIFKVGPASAVENCYQHGTIEGLIGRFGLKMPTPIRYLIWAVAVMFWLVSSPRNREAFYAIGLDSALPLAFCKRKCFVFDNVDNFFLSKRWIKAIRSFLLDLEKFVIKRCLVHIIPSPERIVLPSPHNLVIPNTPARDDLKNARALFERRRSVGSLDHRLTIYLNGWLVDTRGIVPLVKAIRLLSTPEVWLRVLIAGSTGGPWSEKLISQPCADYRGHLSSVESLSLYFESDLVFTAYDPSIDINCIAAPNKWGDCVATGTPFICNSEIVTAKAYMNQRACVAFPYDNPQALANLITRLHEDRGLVAAMSLMIGTIQWEYWDDSMLRVIHRLKEAK